MFGKATVTLSDVTAGNGVVHAIDEVLFTTPPTSNIGNSVESIKIDNSIKFSAKKKNLVELCKDLGFTSFAAAMTMTGIDKVHYFLKLASLLNGRLRVWKLRGKSVTTIF